MKALFLTLFCLFIGCKSDQKSEIIELTKSDTSTILLSENKINFSLEGIVKFSDVEIGDTIVISGASFLVASENDSYFPSLPIIIKPSKAKDYCFYMINHLSLHKQESVSRIIELLRR